MALAPHQADDFPRDPFSRPIPHQPALQNVWVSSRHRDVLPYKCSFINVYPQVPPAPANGQHAGLPADHQEDIPPPVRHEVAWIGRVQDRHHFDVAYEGVVDYHAQPLVDVSKPHSIYLLLGLLLIDDTWT
jgi:hypothetical protein